MVISRDNLTIHLQEKKYIKLDKALRACLFTCFYCNLNL